MSKERITPNTCQLPHTEDGLQAALSLAEIAANDIAMPSWQHRYPETMYVMESVDKEFYFSPVNETKRQSFGYRDLAIVATVKSDLDKKREAYHQQQSALEESV